MLATSTHDSKRAEDVRARINVLSEIIGTMEASGSRVETLQSQPQAPRSMTAPLPSPNDEYLLYQTLVGAWPPESDLRDHNGNDDGWKSSPTGSRPTC
jgi:(1->4)-alpha-D-glucan 1-alpha-D-glucosylmutase